MNLNKRTVETKHVHNDQNENQITTRQYYSVTAMEDFTSLIWVSYHRNRI